MAKRVRVSEKTLESYVIEKEGGGYEFPDEMEITCLTNQTDEILLKPKYRNQLKSVERLVLKNLLVLCDRKLLYGLLYMCKGLVSLHLICDEAFSLPCKVAFNELLSKMSNNKEHWASLETLVIRYKTVSKQVLDTVYDGFPKLKNFELTFEHSREDFSLGRLFKLIEWPTIKEVTATVTKFNKKSIVKLIEKLDERGDAPVMIKLKTHAEYQPRNEEEASFADFINSHEMMSLQDLRGWLARQS